MVKKQPLRMCVSCREMKAKKMLLKVVKSPDGTVSVDLTGKKPGRGAYVCKDEICIKKAEKERRLERALKCSISPELYCELKRESEEAV